MANILIASLGESPIVVTAMAKKLQKDQHIRLDKVIVLYPAYHPQINDGIELIRRYCVCPIESYEFPFYDANSEQNCLQFLKKLNVLLEETHRHNDTVYLGLAGGRKSMTAMVSLFAPFYENVQGLYHILDTMEGTPNANFHHLQTLFDRYCLDNPALEAMMNPPLDRLNLVEIPFKHFLDAQDVRKILQNDEPEQLLEGVALHVERVHPEAKDFWTAIFQNVPQFYTIRLSPNAKKQFDKVQNRNFSRYFSLSKLRNPDWANRSGDNGGKHASFQGKNNSKFYGAKINRIAERIVWYLCQNEIVLAELGMERQDGKYHRVDASVVLDDGYLAPKSFSDYPPEFYPDNEVPSENSILIASVGMSPMVVTQAYTLFQRQGVQIDTVALVFPERNGTIANGIRLLESVFESKNVTVKRYGVALPDVASKKDCEIYLETLVKTIDELRTLYPDSDIKLLLSGGRKGMTALSLFAAQRSGITQVYHTLISDLALEERIERESSIEQLNALGSTNKKAARMFLDEYSKSISLNND